MMHQMLKKVKYFGGNISSVGKGHKQEEKRLRDFKNDFGSDKQLQERVVTSVEKVAKPFRKIPNQKTPVRDDIQGYWIKNLSNIHEWLNKMGDDSLPTWITHGVTVLCQKQMQ